MTARVNARAQRDEKIPACKITAKKERRWTGTLEITRSPAGQKIAWGKKTGLGIRTLLEGGPRKELSDGDDEKKSVR